MNIPHDDEAVRPLVPLSSMSNPSSFHHPNVVPSAVTSSVDVAQAYDTVPLPPRPPAGDDHAVPVRGDHVVVPPEPHHHHAGSTTNNNNNNVGVPPNVGLPPPQFTPAAAAAGMNHPYLPYTAGPSGIPMSSYGWLEQQPPPSSLPPNHFPPDNYHHHHQQQQQQMQMQNTYHAALLHQPPLTYAAMALPYPMNLPPPQQPLHMSMEELQAAHQQHKNNFFVNMHLQQQQQQFSKSAPPLPEPMKPKPPPSKEWIQNIVGRDWEIFWKKQDSQVVLLPKTRTTGSKSNREREEKSETEEEDDEDEETWYDATVVAVDTKNSDPNVVYCHVKFLGDTDRLFRMPLTSDVVRPSARAWIRRTKAILLASGGTAVNDWETSLPHDTSISTTDAVKMKEILDEIAASYPCTQSVTYHQNQDENAKQSFQQLREEHVTIICPLLKLIRHQIYLRSKLAPIDVDNNDDDEDGSKMSDKSDDDEDSVLTEDFVDFLVSSLQILEKACLWHSECWSLMKRLFAVNRDYCQSPTKLISKDYLVYDLFAKGHDVLIQLSHQSNEILTMASPVTKCKSDDRKRACVTDLELHNQTKRRRVYDQNSAGNFNEVHVDFMDHDVRSIYRFDVDIFLNQVCARDERWYAQCFRYMLNHFVKMVLTPFLEWERNARFFLSEDCDVEGCEKTLESESLETLAFPSDRHTNCGRRDIKYEDIESSIESANNHRLLKCFDFAAYVKRLCSKLAEIDKFERETKILFENVFTEPKTYRTSEDPTLLGLEEHEKEARRKGSAVEGVNPIGQSLFTRGDISTAIENRKWMLNLYRAETIRERTALVTWLVEHPPTIDVRNYADARSMLFVLLSRASALEKECSTELAETIKIDSLLDHRTVSRHEHEVTELLVIQKARTTLRELKFLPRISLAEEKLAIRCDVLEWQSKAQDVLSRQKPRFIDIQSLCSGLENIRSGDSANYNYIKIGTLPLVDVEDHIRSFLTSEFNDVLGPLYIQTMALYKESKELKKRADMILAALDSGFSHSTDMRTSTRVTTQNFELKDIDDVLVAYSFSKVDMAETFGKLQTVYDQGTKWVQTMQFKLQDKSLTFEEIRIFLIEMEPNRPIGVAVEPDQEIVAALQHMLRWYATLNKYEYIGSDCFDRDSLLDQLTEGMSLLEFYCQRNQNTTNFNILLDRIQSLLEERKHRANLQCLDVSKLRSDRIATISVDRLIDVSTDEQHGAPMFFLFRSMWEILVDDFVSRCGNLAFKQQTTLESANYLWGARPVVPQYSPYWAKCQMFISSTNVQELKDLICDGEEVEKEAHSVIFSVKNLHEQDWTENLQSIFERVKDIHENVTSRWKNNGQLTLTLDRQLEEELRLGYEFICWLSRILPYDFLYTESLSDSSKAVNERVPLDILYSLNKESPKSHRLRSFSLIQKRIKLYCDRASKWEKEIALLLNKRRRVDPNETFSREEFEKLVEMSRCDLLTKVMMPREKEILALIENTQKFESAFLSFFTKECCVECPALDAIKETTLSAEDGTFLLEMLTGNDVFENLNDSISNLSLIADLTKLNTSEKVAFQWIGSMFRWIQRMKSSVSSNIPYCQHRSIGQVCCDKLISEGGDLLRQIPDSLVLLLRLRKIYVSTSVSDGKLELESLQGKDNLSLSITTSESYAVQPLGVILLRWWSFLYNALNSDRRELLHWNVETKGLIDNCSRLNRTDESRLTNEPKLLTPFYKCRDQAERLLVRLGDLFLTPCSQAIEQCRFALTYCQKIIYTKSSFAAFQAYVKSQYMDDAAVISNSLRLLDALAERTELARHTEHDSVEMESKRDNSGSICNAREQCRCTLLDVLKSVLSGVMIAQMDAKALCATKAWEIENALYDIYGCDPLDDYVAKAKSIKLGLKDAGNLQLTLSVLSGALPADKLVNMSSEDFVSPDIRKIKEEQAKKDRQSRNLTLQQDAADNAKIPSEQVPGDDKRLTAMNGLVSGTSRDRQETSIRYEANNNFDLSENDHGAKNTFTSAQNAVAKSSFKNTVDEKSRTSLLKVNVGSLIDGIAKRDPSANGVFRGIKSSIVKSKSVRDGFGACAPPAPPSLNPLSDALSKKHPALPEQPPPNEQFDGPNPSGLVETDTGENIFHFIYSMKERTETSEVQLELDDLSPDHKVFPKSWRKERWVSYERLISFIQTKRQNRDNIELKFKIRPASDSAAKGLKWLAGKSDDSKLVLLMDSKCQVDCYSKNCQDCAKLYLLTPHFQRRFGDLFHLSDPTSMYVFTWRKRR